jgi:hypothetical protein
MKLKALAIIMLVVLGLTALNLGCGTTGSKTIRSSSYSM